MPAKNRASGRQSGAEKIFAALVLICVNQRQMFLQGMRGNYSITKLLNYEILPSMQESSRRQKGLFACAFDPGKKAALLNALTIFTKSQDDINVKGKTPPAAEYG
jgi:hypothetical protein